MFGRYIVKRVFFMLLSFVIIIFLYSAIFNVVMDQTLRSQIHEMVQGEIMGMTDSTPQEIQIYREQRIQTLYARYHLEDPTLQRIFWRAVGILKLDWGQASMLTSSNGSRDVFKIVVEKIYPTLLLFGIFAILDVTIGVLLGMKKAQKPGSKLDQSTSIMTMVVFGMPSWWLAMIFIMIFVYTIPIFPSGGMGSVPPPEGFAAIIDTIYHMALPILTLLCIGFWARAYMTRNIVVGTLQEDFIMSARARGLPEKKVLYGHGLRAAAPPIVTMGVMSLLMSIQGRLIFEGIFNWPGMGNLYWIAVQQNDIPVLLGLLATTTFVYLAGLAFLDVIYGFLDPRIKVGGKQ